jgi:hypothetical protein
MGLTPAQEKRVRQTLRKAAEYIDALREAAADGINKSNAVLAALLDEAIPQRDACLRGLSMRMTS